MDGGVLGKDQACQNQENPPSTGSKHPSLVLL